MQDWAAWYARTCPTMSWCCHLARELSDHTTCQHTKLTWLNKIKKICRFLSTEATHVLEHIPNLANWASPSQKQTPTYLKALINLCTTFSSGRKQSSAETAIPHKETYINMILSLAVQKAESIAVFKERLKLYHFFYSNTSISTAKENSNRVLAFWYFWTLTYLYELERMFFNRDFCRCLWIGASVKSRKCIWFVQYQTIFPECLCVSASIVLCTISKKNKRSWKKYVYCKCLYLPSQNAQSVTVIKIFIVQTPLCYQYSLPRQICT